MNQEELNGKVALVTGAGRNIGRAIALALARAGANVVVNVRQSEAEGRAVAAEIAAMGRTSLLCVADVTDRGAVDRMMAQVRDRFGRLDLLVNNAATRHEAPFATLDYATWRRTLDVCLDGAFHCTQAALPLLTAAGTASVVNIGGLTAHTGAAHRVHVVTAKAGIVGLTRALAHDLAESGVTVNCISPGMIDTERKGDSASSKPHHHATRRPLVGRRGYPDEVAAAVLWLAGTGGRFVTGQVIHVNGGTFLG